MNVAWAKGWLRSFSGTDTEELLAMYADGARFEDVTLGHTVRGKLKLRPFFAAFVDPSARRNTFTVREYCGSPSAGAVEWKWRAQHVADFMGIPAAGKETTVRGVSVVTFRRGKVVTQHDYWDARGLIHQLTARSAKRARVGA